MEDYRRRTAVHEAGHAVIGRVVGQACGNSTIVINADEDESGHTFIGDVWETFGRWDKLGKFRGQTMVSIIRGRIMATMAGREAEIVILGSFIGGDEHDCRQIAIMFDEHSAVLPAGSPADEYPFNYDTRLRFQVRHLVRRHRATIEHVAALLLERQTLQAEEIDRVCAKRHR